MLRVLKAQHFVSPTPPAGGQMASKDLQTQEIRQKYILEQPSQARFSRMQIWYGEDGLGYKVWGRWGTPPLSNEQLLPRFPPGRVHGIDWLTGRSHLDPRPFCGKLEAPGCEQASRRGQEFQDGWLVRDPYSNETRWFEMIGHWYVREQMAHFTQISDCRIATFLAANGSVRPRWIHEDQAEGRGRVPEGLASILDRSVQILGAVRDEAVALLFRSSSTLTSRHNYPGETPRPLVASFAHVPEAIVDCGGGHEVGNLSRRAPRYCRPASPISRLRRLERLSDWLGRCQASWERRRADGDQLALFN